MFVESIEKSLSAADKANNTTRNLPALTKLEYHILKRENAGKYPDRSRHKDPAKHKAYLDQLDRAIERLRLQDPNAKAAEKTVAEQSPSDDPSEPASEMEEDEDEDGRGVIAIMQDDVDALHRALSPTINHFRALTGQTPERTVWTTTYWAVYRDFRSQLNRRLGLPSGAREPRLLGYGKWTGPIKNYEFARRMENPEEDPDRA